MEKSPIALFVYNRPDHTKRTVEALLLNDLAKDTDLYIYSDAAKNQNAVSAVSEVRSYIKTITGFSKVEVIERTQNLGLASSIIDGVSQVCKEHGRAIVLEDDIVTSQSFLIFMNSALEYYENQKDVWHISGWNYPTIDTESDDSFLWPVMNCWGWATWSDRWEKFNKSPARLVNTWNKEQIDQFNLDDTFDFWFQVQLNYIGKLNTWAVFWYATIFENNGLCLNPQQSFVNNIGHDGSGENCKRSEAFIAERLNKDESFTFPDATKKNITDETFQNIKDVMRKQEKRASIKRLPYKILFYLKKYLRK